MKNILLTVLLSAFMVNGIFSQITITKNDMPQAGELINYNVTYSTNGVDYQQSGEDFTWDFSTLGLVSQEADTFVTVSSTPWLYQAVFNLPFWSPPASLAQRKGEFSLIPGLTFDDYIDFFKNKSSSYNYVGFGITINSIPIPLKFDNAEVVYDFPLSYSSTPDSSEAGFSVGIPDVGYIETQRKRVNEVDGWGTLITPLGTFEALRMKSTVYSYDSIYIDSLSIGYAINIEEVEYKWLGNDYGRPLLKVTESNIFPTRIEYIAETIQALSIDAGEDVTITQGETIELEATVDGGVPPYLVIWSNGGIGTEISVSPQATTTYTATVTDLSFTSVSDDVTVTVEVPLVQQQIELPDGWSSISTYVFPENLPVNEVLSPIEDQLVIFQNPEGYYYPESGVNNLGDWDINSGYMIKMNGAATLQIDGYQPAVNSVFLVQGWNIMPVVSSCNVDVSTIQAQLEGNLEMIKEVAGTRMYWPEKAIETLQVLEPGKAYMILLGVQTQFIFPDCE